MSVLVTGAAGYIGSHVAWMLTDAGHETVVLDNLITGFRSLVPTAATFIEGDVGDRELLRRIFSEHSVHAVIHLAGSTILPESVAFPIKYYSNNMASSLALIEAAVEAKVRAFVFSSTAAVYADGLGKPVAETAAIAPATAYGRSKLVTEWMLEDISRAHGLPYAALRYFNVAGADPLGRTGQSTPDATHLIKVACQVALGRHSALSIYGDDFQTSDGTGVRDFIHVWDLAAAHLSALDHLRNGRGCFVANCGYGNGYSVLDVVKAVERVTGRPLPVVRAPRRPGDIGHMVSNPTYLRSLLSWEPTYDNIDVIVASALAWERALG